MRLVMLALTLIVPALARAAVWEVDPAHSAVGFAVRHLMISTVRGEFHTFSGKATGDPAHPEAATVEATIDASSIDTRNEKRDQHLKSPDFLDVEKFPTITFKSKKIEKAGDKVKVTGDLTIHGVTKEVVLDVEGPTPAVKDPFTGNPKAGAHATTRINRKDFGLVWNKALEGGGVLVGEDVDITIDVEAVQKGN